MQKVKSLSHVWLFATPWTVAHQAPPSVGFFQARVLEWVAISFSRGSSQPRNQTWVSRIAGRLFTNWATRGSLLLQNSPQLSPVDIHHHTWLQNFIFLVMRTFKIYSLLNMQYSILTTVTILYITFLWLTGFITGSLYLVTPFICFAHPWPLAAVNLFSVVYELFFFSPSFFSFHIYICASLRVNFCMWYEVLVAV